MIWIGALLAACGVLVVGVAELRDQPRARRAGAAVIVVGLALSALGALVSLVEML